MIPFSSFAFSLALAYSADKHNQTRNDVKLAILIPVYRWLELQS